MVHTISSLQAGEISPRRSMCLSIRLSARPISTNVSLFFCLCVLLLSDFIIQPPAAPQLLLFVVIPTAPLFYLLSHTLTAFHRTFVHRFCFISFSFTLVPISAPLLLWFPIERGKQQQLDNNTHKHTFCTKRALRKRQKSKKNVFLRAQHLQDFKSRSVDHELVGRSIREGKQFSHCRK